MITATLPADISLISRINLDGLEPVDLYDVNIGDTLLVVRYSISRAEVVQVTRITEPVFEFDSNRSRTGRTLYDVGAREIVSSWSTGDTCLYRTRPGSAAAHL